MNFNLKFKILVLELLSEILLYQLKSSRLTSENISSNPLITKVNKLIKEVKKEAKKKTK